MVKKKQPRVKQAPASQRKQPKASSYPKPSKQPKSIEAPHINGAPLSWRFGAVDHGGPFSWNKLPDDDYRKVMEKLHKFESMDMSAINNSGSHSIEIDKISKEGKDRLIEIQQDDIDELMSFRIMGKPRVFCIPHGSVMRVLWWDPEHRVCLSEKKNT